MRAITALSLRLQRTAALILVAAGLVLTTSAHADPIPVGTTPADDLIFNFDFTSALAGAPFADIKIVANLTGFTMGDALFLDVFKNVNATGGVDFSVGPVSCTICGSGQLQITLDYVSGSSADILDGIFSIGFRLGSGAMDLTSIAATAANAAGGTATLTGAPTTVPEPSTISLFLLVLALMAGRHLRTKRPWRGQFLAGALRD